MLIKTDEACAALACLIEVVKRGNIEVESIG
jgi:hypothetical protein